MDEFKEYILKTACIDVMWSKRNLKATATATLGIWHVDRAQFKMLPNLPWFNEEISHWVKPNDKRIILIEARQYCIAIYRVVLVAI